MKSLCSLLLTCILCSSLSDAQSLIVAPPLIGSTEQSTWSDLTSANLNLIQPPPRHIYEAYPDVFLDFSVDFRVYAPGYGAKSGLYSWTGGYEVTLAKSVTDFAIKQAVFQLDLVWDPATAFPSGSGPRLSYNGGNQRLAPISMTFGGTRQIENNTGVPEMQGITHFVYRGVTWQWDLSEIEGDVGNIIITMPFANHTSVVAARIDVASEFEDIGGTTLSPIEVWRGTYFPTHLNTGNAANTADPDHDGIPNLVEYALGTDPTSITPDSNGTDSNGNPFILQGHGSQNLPVTLVSQDRLRLAFLAPVSPPAGITYRVQASTNLSDWTTLAEKTGSGNWVWKGTGTPQIATRPTDGAQPWTWTGDGPPTITTKAVKERVHYVIGDELTSPQNRFMRLHVSY